MDANKAMRLMIDGSGETPAQLGNAMGVSRTYIYTLRTQAPKPRIDTFARLAHECGYQLMLQRKGGGEEIEIYSPEDARDLLDTLAAGDIARAYTVADKELIAQYDHAGVGISDYVKIAIRNTLKDPDFLRKHEGDSERDMWAAADEAIRGRIREREEAFFKKPEEKPADSDSGEHKDS